jgi:hypothetical protein
MKKIRIIISFGILLTISKISFSQTVESKLGGTKASHIPLEDPNHFQENAVLKEKYGKLLNFNEFLKRNEIKPKNLKLIATDKTGNTHYLQSPNSKTISMNLETGDCELISVKESQKMKTLQPEVNNSTMPVYILYGCTNFGSWIYKDENGKQHIIEPKSKSTNSRTKSQNEIKFAGKFVWRLLEIDVVKLPEMELDDDLKMTQIPR